MFFNVSRSILTCASNATTHLRWLGGLRLVRQMRANAVTVPEVMSSEDASLVETNRVLSWVNESIKQRTTGRLFAIISITSRQERITENDVLVVHGVQPYDVGDKIRLGKILLLGSKEFTLIGRPVLPQSLVRVEATVIEKTYSHTAPDFFYVPRKNIRILKFRRKPLSLLRINRIELLEALPAIVNQPNACETN